MAQLRIPLDEKRFNSGQTWKDYMAQMGDTRAKTEANYANSKLTDEERKFFGGISGVKYVVMLAENWCGDVHRNSPLIAHIVEAMPGAELRVFLRDQNADLRDTFLNNGYQSIPVVALLRQGLERDRSLARARARRDHRDGRDPRPDARSGAAGCAQGAAGRGDGRVPQSGPGRVRQAGWGALARRGRRGQAPARDEAGRQEVVGGILVRPRRPR